MDSSQGGKSHHQHIQTLPSQRAVEAIKGKHTAYQGWEGLIFFFQVLYLDEERILEEFNKVKQGLKTSSMDDDTFEATRETCMFLGGKLMDIRHQKQAT